MIKKKTKITLSPKEQIKLDIDRVRENLKHTYSMWNYTNDPKAIDMCILKIASLEAEHTFLTKRYAEVQDEAC